VHHTNKFLKKEQEGAIYITSAVRLKPLKALSFCIQEQGESHDR